MPRRRKGSSRAAPIEEEEMLEEETMDDEEDCEDGGRGGDDEDEEDDFSEGSGGRGKGGRERPGQRNAANARERARMRVLSRAFCRLKTTLPWVPPDTKLSKLDTLRLATSYIAHLRAMLSADEDSDGGAAETVVPRKGAAPQRGTKGAESPDRGKMMVPSNPLHPLNLTWPFSFQRSASSLPSSSPASSTSSSSTPSGANGPTGISHMNEWSPAPDEAPSHYCQGNHITMDHMNNHQTRMSSPMHHNLIHHHHPHHFLPSSYPDSSLLHMA